MATSDYAGTYYSDPTGVGANVPAELAKVAETLEGDTVVSFVDTGTRDTKFATLTAAQKKGVICHVEGQGPFHSDGTTWRRVLVPGININRGNFQSTTDVNGIITQNHGMIATPNSVFVTMEGDNPTSALLKPVVVLINSSQFLVKFFNTTTGVVVPSGTFASFYWQAVL